MGSEESESYKEASRVGAVAADGNEFGSPSCKGLQSVDHSYSAFVDNIPPMSFRRWLMEIFGTVGSVIDVFISKRPRIAKSSFFAFVRFYHWEEACNAIKVTNGKESKGFHLSVSEAKERRYKTKAMIKGVSGGDKGFAARTKSVVAGSVRVSPEPFHGPKGMLKGEEHGEVVRWPEQHEKVK